MSKDAKRAGALLSLLGKFSRGTPYFKGKWRVIDWLFHRWFKNTRYVEVISLGSWLQIDCHLWDEVQQGIWCLGTNHERREAAYFRSILKPGMVFLDVGANIGYYSLLAAHDWEEKMDVHAFEPITAQHRDLTENLKRNGIKSVKANRLIVSDHCGSMTINLGQSWNSGSASVAKIYDDVTASETTEAITLDAYVTREKLARVDIIKIDVEGHEVLVLKGAKEILARFRPVMMVEVKDEILRQSGTSREELYGMLREMNYEPFLIVSGNRLQAIIKPRDGGLIVFKPRASA